MQKINVSQESLDSIIKALADLQEVGGNATDDIWLPGDGLVKARKLPQSFITLRPELLDTLDAMKRVESMMNTFCELARSCDRKLRSLQREFRPSFMHCGIQMLPEEILSNIFNLLAHGIEESAARPNPYEVTRTYDPEVVLSHVSSRFRSICLATPSLWSRLSSAMSTWWIRTRLERSNNSLLTIEMRELGFRRIERMACFYELVTRHASRWRIVQISVSDLAGNDQQSYLKGLRLPELEYISSSHADIGPVKEWAMPKLNYVRHDIDFPLPSPTSNPFPLDTIRSLTLSISKYDHDVQAMAEFLSSLSSLDELRLNIGTIFEMNLEHDIVLPRITYLSLKFHGCTSSHQFMHLLRMPSLVKLHLDINVMETFDMGGPVYYDPMSWSDFASGEQQHFMKDLNISFRHERHDDGIEVKYIFHMFPELEKLVLDTPNNLPILSARNLRRKKIRTPPLRSLSVSHQSMTFLNEFIRAMKWSGRWGGFETLRIEGSWLLSRQEVEDLIYQNKLEPDGFNNDEEDGEGADAD